MGAQVRLPPAKGSELLGLLLATAALLLAASLGSYHPADPSFLHELPERGAPIHNWAGMVGAQLAALLLGLVGLTALLLPLALWVPAWRLLRRRAEAAVPGRGVGLLLTLLSLPVLAQLIAGAVHWRGLPIDAGGVLGRFLCELLLARLNYPGSLLIAAAAVLAGGSLLVQSTLGDILAAWRRRLAHLGERLALVWARWRQSQDKERLRRRVVAKHLRRREQEADAASTAGVTAAPVLVSALGQDRLDLPLRVVERNGEGAFAVRRVRSEGEGQGRSPVAGSERSLATSPSRSSHAEQPLLFEPESSSQQLPPLNLLLLESPPRAVAENELIRLGETIRQSCGQFGVEGTLEGISPGPVITVFEFKPAPGVKMSQIVNLQDDLALALRAESVRIDRMAGRSTLGIEVPNPTRSVIRLGALLSHERFRRSPSVLTMALGTDIHGEPYYADLATMPHLLVAGATGSGKSVGLQGMITSILYKARREEVQFIFIDPKRVELGVYDDIPHLKTEVVVEPKKAANALRWAVAEMERRYRLLAEVHVRSIDYYNRAICDPEVKKRLALEEGSELAESDFRPLPYYVIVIDELADLMMVAAAEVESSIARLAQMARAVGIHLIVATQRPSVDVITGTIKANFPCRMAFATTSRHDSRTILDTVGSERLLGKGDMLLMPPGSSRLLRLHGAYISEQETAGLIRWLKKQGRPELDLEVVRFAESAAGPGAEAEGDDDDLYDEAARLVVSEGKASASFLQRRMRVGFSRAARLIDLMERDGLLGPAQGSKPREVLVAADYFAEIDARE
jgi:DNA segregation ATPase FtsK/SpoIIIE, S-DNA-T family